MSIACHKKYPRINPVSLTNICAASSLKRYLIQIYAMNMSTTLISRYGLVPIATKLIS